MQRQGDAAGKRHGVRGLAQQFDLEGRAGGKALVAVQPGKAVQNVEDPAQRGKAGLGDRDDADVNRS